MKNTHQWFCVISAGALLSAIAVGCDDGKVDVVADSGTATDTGAGMDSGGTMDGGTRADASRVDAPRTDAARADGRADVRADAPPRDVTAEAGTMSAVPTGNVRIFRQDLAMQCFSTWNDDQDPDDGSLYLTACGDDPFQSWRFEPIAGRAGAYRIKNNGWADDYCLVTMAKTNGNIRARMAGCTDANARTSAWRVQFDPASPSEFQLVSDTTAMACLSMAENEWGYQDSCVNLTDFYFTTRAF